MAEDEPIVIRSRQELDAVLAQARSEGWTHLALASPRFGTVPDLGTGAWAGRAFRLGFRLEPVPSGLTALTRLTSLNLWHSRIGDEGAKAIAALTGLTSLDLASNGIGDEGAQAIAALTGLTSLDLSGNYIGDEGAKAITALTGLTSLDLSRNDIGAEGAQAIAALTGLTSLDLWGNGIGTEGAKAVLDAWAERPDAPLTYLDLRNNGDLSSLLPAEVLESRSASEILAAYRRFREAERRPLNEAKLLVVGNEAVGKTSLVRYLVDNQPRREDERKTPGIAIREKIETRGWALGDSEIRLNVWDFGGQEIMHGTHKYFLTARSLYLLVLEARREDDDRAIHEWLRTIRNRGGESPLIVVVNKCEDGRDLRLDEPGLRREFPNIVAFVRTSCNEGQEAAATIDQLRELIGRTVSEDPRLRHVRDPIPAPWLRVEDSLARMSRKRRVLGAAAFVRLCEEGGGPDGEPITDPHEQRALLGLLHDLGVVVAHGLARDAPAALREVTLLDPNWLTVAIYALLNSPRIRDQQGEFDRRDLDELLDPDEYPTAHHEFILDMMQDPDVGLCMALADTQQQRYLIPEALPAGEPDYDIGTWQAQSLRFRYEYRLLPRGLLPRFIVQAHRNLTANPTTWRTGVVLGAAGCKVLVKADLDRRRVDVLVAGPGGQRRSALNVVLNDLDEVHRRNPESKPTALVPLIGERELAESYEHLLRLEVLHGPGHTYLPRDAKRQYSVSELLDGVRRERPMPADDRYGERGIVGDRRTVAPAAPSGQQPASPAAGKPSVGVHPIRGVVILLGAVCALILVLVIAWAITGSAAAVALFGAMAVVLFVVTGAFVAACTNILGGGQLERIFLRALGVVSPIFRGESEGPTSGRDVRKE